MASFRKIGGRTRNINITNKIETKAKPTPMIKPQSNEPCNHEMHIAQIQSEQNQSVFYPLMSDNETPRYFEDAGLYYCFNQTVQDFVLNADYVSATTIFNVDTLTFADGSVMSSALESNEKMATKEVYNVYVELDAEESKQVVLPTNGVYLITFCLNTGSHLTIKLNQSCFTQTNSGSLTIHYDKRFADDANDMHVPLGKNQTGSPHLYFEKRNENEMETDTKQNSHITITRIA